jgi:hypothetical protein
MSWTIFLLKFSEYSRDQEIAFTDANPRSIWGYVQGPTRLRREIHCNDGQGLAGRVGELLHAYRYYVVPNTGAARCAARKKRCEARSAGRFPRSRSATVGTANLQGPRLRRRQ